MKKLLTGLLLACVTFFYSCEFNCSVGQKKESASTTKLDEKTGVRTSNEISLQPEGLKIEKAYLIFEDGSRVPADNIVDFSKGVKLVLIIDSGWTVKDGKVMLGASEKIEAENGEVMLDEEDLFKAYTDGVSATDAKTIALTARIKLKREIRPLTTFTISFKLWDKNSNAFVQGRYKLYSK